MKKLMFFLAIILSSCITYDNVEESICVDRCYNIEGTILNSVTKEPLQNVKVEGSYFKGSFLISSRDVKAKTTTDINGFYEISFEVFDEELDGSGVFEVNINNEDNYVFSPYGQIKLLNLDTEDSSFDTLYIADFLIPRAAKVEYDMDCLRHLKEAETATFSVSYTFDGIDGPINAGQKLEFNSETEKDDGTLRVPAAVPVTIIANQITSSDTIELKRMITTLVADESIKVEVGI